MRKLLPVALLASLSSVASAESATVMWNIQAVAQSSAGPQHFAFSVPDDGCQSSVARSSKGPQAALKICMGNGLAPHTAYGWLVTDADMASLDGDRKFEHAQQFSIGTDGKALQVVNNLYSVTVSRSR